MAINIRLVEGFDPVPDCEPTVLATYSREGSTVELCRYPAGPYSVRQFKHDDLVGEEVFEQSVVASLAYNKATEDVWADWVGDLTDMARIAHEQQLEDLAVAVDMLGIVTVAEECAS